MARSEEIEGISMVTDRYNESGGSLQLYMQEIRQTPLLTREDKVHQLHGASVELTETLGREPSDAELATHLAISPAKVAQLRTYGISPTSLAAPIGDEDDNRFSDIVQDEGALTPYELLRVKTMRQEIRQHLKDLTPREAEIVTMRFGLDGKEPRTLDEVGKKFKVTRERIRQIQEIALNKLRRGVDTLANHHLICRS